MYLCSLLGGPYQKNYDCTYFLNNTERLIALRSLAIFLKKTFKQRTGCLLFYVLVLLSVDDEEEVETLCQDVISDMEKVLGEPLQKYF